AAELGCLFVVFRRGGLITNPAGAVNLKFRHCRRAVTSRPQVSPDEGGLYRPAGALRRAVSRVRLPLNNRKKRQGPDPRGTKEEKGNVARTFAATTGRSHGGSGPCLPV